jgi:hypothetical protein
LELVTLNTSFREQNHHQSKKADDAQQKNIKQSALLRKEKKHKLQKLVRANMASAYMSASPINNSIA